MKITQNQNLNTNSVAINASNLVKEFGDLFAVDDVSFKINQGEIVGILGPNGAGKTTTIRLLTGVFQLEKNAKIEIFGKDITKNPRKYKKKFGIVPEISNAFSDYSVWQNLKFSGGIYGISKEKVETRSKILLTQFNLIEKIYSKTKTLSKGLKQRLNFCLALLHEPPILILDEPTGGLDPLSVKLMRTQILQLKKEGKTILITTHDMREAQNICDRILIMNRGKIIADENPNTLREQFKSTSTILFKIAGDIPVEQEHFLLDMFSITKEKNGYYLFSSYNTLKDISTLYNVSKERNIKISDLKVRETSLEEVFLHLIKEDVFVKKEDEKND
ncbi:MAG: ABC transporter ATP-binding protein [Candidatus Lokiarchaeota archaeon]|nr:ABC transporter ATP-binding protein [Candidatus Lokiarchaeota archaeon]